MRTSTSSLYEHKLRLPDAAKTHPHPDVAVQPDFYYERDGLPGICIFVDGPVHAGEKQAERDQEVQGALEDRGVRVIVVRPGEFGERVQRHRH